MQVPNKLKVFMWKAVKGGLAVGSNLARCIPSLEPECKVCHEEVEFELHLFTRCSRAKQVWFASSFALRVHSIPGNTFRERWQYLVSFMEDREDDLALLCHLCWRLWKARNASIFEGLPILVIRSKAST